MTKLYIDTNILIYAVEDSKNYYGKDISNSSSKLFWESALCKYHLIISTWTLNELKRIRNSEKFIMLFKIIKKKVIIQRFTDEDIKQAKEQNPNHFQDELHGILALKSNADYLVTRNIVDFDNFKDKIKVINFYLSPNRFSNSSWSTFDLFNSPLIALIF